MARGDGRPGNSSRSGCAAIAIVAPVAHFARMLCRTLTIVLAALGLPGCMTAAAIYQARLDAISADDFAWSTGNGPSTLVGQALTDGSLVKDGGCRSIELRPAGFGVELSGPAVSPGRPAYRNTLESVVRKANCDAAGRFRFNDVPAGRYYLVAEVPTESAAYTGERFSAWLWREVRLTPGTKSVEMRRVCETVLRWRGTERGAAPETVCDVAPLRLSGGLMRPRTPSERALVDAAAARAKGPILFVRNDTDQKARVEFVFRRSEVGCRGPDDAMSGAYDLGAGEISKFFCTASDFARVTFIQEGAACTMEADRLALVERDLPLSRCRSR